MPGLDTIRPNFDIKPTNKPYVPLSDVYGYKRDVPYLVRFNNAQKDYTGIDLANPYSLNSLVNIADLATTLATIPTGVGLAKMALSTGLRAAPKVGGYLTRQGIENTGFNYLDDITKGY